MTNGQFTALTLAARELLARARPEAVRWAQAQWTRWLAVAPESSAIRDERPGLIVISALSTLDDLSVHLGLMQLLSSGEANCRPILTLPTSESAALARVHALRAGWDQTVSIWSDDDCHRKISELPAEQSLLAFAGPAALSVSQFAAVRALRSFATEDIFLGRAADYRAWLEGRIAAPSETLARLLEFKTPDLTEKPPREARTCAVAIPADVSPRNLQPWMLTAYLNRGGGGNRVMQAFAHGVGCRIAYAEDEPERLRDVPVVWGVLRQSDRILDQAKRQESSFFYVDHAYFERGHGKNYRITRNRYEAGAVRLCPSDRVEALDIGLRPWKSGGQEIVVCPPTDYFIQAHGCHDWLDETLAMLGSLTDRPIRLREKPQAGEAVVPLSQALASAHALVTHSSNVAVEAVCLGTPVFVSPSSAAAPVGRTDLSLIEDPIYPDRSAWLAHLAYSQFSLEEIEDGRAWCMLREFEEREFA